MQVGGIAVPAHTARSGDLDEEMRYGIMQAASTMASCFQEMIGRKR